MTKRKPNIWDKVAEVTGTDRQDVKLVVYAIVFGTERAEDWPTIWQGFIDVVEGDPSVLKPILQAA